MNLAGIQSLPGDAVQQRPVSSPLSTGEDAISMLLRDGTQAASPRLSDATNRSASREDTEWMWAHLPVGLAILDGRGRLIEANALAESLLGLDATVKAAVLDEIIDKRDQSLVASYLSGLCAQTLTSAIEFRVPRACSGSNQTASLGSGSVRWLRLQPVSVSRATAAVMLTEITDQKVLEIDRQATLEHLRQLQRLAVVNEMSAGVAHDFNNILQVIEAYSAALHMELQADGCPKHHVAEIVAAARRGSMLAKRLLAISRKDSLNKQAIDLGQLIEQSLYVVAHCFEKNVKIETHLCAGSVRCQLDPTLIEQVIMNLCINARDAMPQGGVLRVELTQRLLPACARGGIALSEGAYACVTISDTGVGIPVTALEQIFEPFFTTKRSGQGTGLGLSIARGIVAEHGGAIEVESKVGQGSTFTILLPLPANV